MIEISKIEQFDVFAGKQIMIAGPCSAESERQVMECALSLAAQGVRIFRAGVWKPRTRPGCFEGAGTPALKWLEQVKAQTGMAVTTEVANSRHVEAAMKAGVDILWIGARTTTSPFAVQEIADALKGADVPVLVKNPINAELELWMGAFERLSAAGITRLAAIHRGFSSYGERIYRYSPQWQIPVELRRLIPGLPIICDPSHMAGKRDLVAPLSQMALDMKADGLFIEVHTDPDHALSDNRQQITPQQFKQLTDSLMIHKDTTASDMAVLKPYRDKIQNIDRQIASLLAQRLDLAREAGDLKQMLNLAVLQPERYRSLADDMVAEGLKYGLNQEFVRAVFEALHAESINNQLDKYNKTK